MDDARFWAKVDMDGKCWLWKGALWGKGYGAVRRQGKVMGAHRWSWTITNGAIPDGMIVLHKCDTPNCVNPKHLRIGTYKDNLQDMIDRGRDNWARGERQRSAKLTAIAVIRLRKLVANGMSQKDAARLYGIAKSTVSVIISGKTWAHVA